MHTSIHVFIYFICKYIYTYINVYKCLLIMPLYERREPIAQAYWASLWGNRDCVQPFTLRIPSQSKKLRMWGTHVRKHNEKLWIIETVKTNKNILISPMSLQKKMIIQEEYETITSYYKSNDSCQWFCFYTRFTS